MSGLADFITARLAEDEAMAQRNTEPHGLGDDGNPDHGCGYPDYQTYSDADTKAADDYIRHFRPLRVLREVTAKRAILERHRDPGHMCPEPPDDEWTYWEAGEQVRAVYPCGDLRSLAAVWSDHPDYRAEWAPAASEGTP